MTHHKVKRQKQLFVAGKFNENLVIQLASLISLASQRRLSEIIKIQHTRVKANRLFVTPKLKGLVRLKLKCYYGKSSFI